MALYKFTYLLTYLLTYYPATNSVKTLRQRHNELTFDNDVDCSDVVCSDEFLNLPVDHVAKLVEDDRLAVSSEEQVPLLMKLFWFVCMYFIIIIIIIITELLWRLL